MKINTSKEATKNFERPKIEEGLYTALLKEVKEISKGQYGKRVALIYAVQPSNTEVSFICYVPRNCNSKKISYGKNFNCTWCRFR